MYEDGMKILFEWLYSNDELTGLLADNVDAPTREVEINGEFETVRNPAIYDGWQPDNAVAPFVSITSDAGDSPHFALANIRITFDVYTDNNSSLMAMRIYEIITAELEFARQGTGSIYRFYTNADMIDVTDEDRPEINHKSFTATMKYIRRDYVDIFQ